MNTRFKVGDRVGSKSTGQIGVIVCIDQSPETGDVAWFGVEYPNPTYTSHDLDGHCRPGHGYWDRHSSLTLFNETGDGKLPAQQKLDQLKKYFESGNDLPVQQATIKAKDFWAIYNS